MEIMQFKSFVFPHNPAVITVEAPCRHARFFCPGHGEQVQALGTGVRSVRCTGSFFAPTPAGAAALVSAFAALTRDCSPGVLILPGLDSMEAVLTGFSWRGEGMGCQIPYEITFVEREAGG